MHSFTYQLGLESNREADLGSGPIATQASAIWDRRAEDENVLVRLGPPLAGWIVVPAVN